MKLTQRKLESILINEGIIQAAAIEDPEGYDGGKTELAMTIATQQINELLSPIIVMTCGQCGNRSPDCAPEEGDGGWWCLDCIELWEKKHKQHWADGSPLKQVFDE